MSIENKLIETFQDKSITWVFFSRNQRFFFENLILEKKKIKTSNYTDWDTFKEFLLSSIINKKPIDKFIRNIFINQLLEKNKRKIFLKKIIPIEYKDDYNFIISYIAKILPFLNSFFNKIDKDQELKNKITNSIDEDFYQDLLIIYKEYSIFLEEKNLFEKSWQQIKLKNKNRKYIFVYPEFYSDFDQFQYGIKNYKTIHYNENIIAKQDKPNNKLKVFDNIEKEILWIFSKIEELLIDNEYNDIIISCANLTSIFPYLETEASIKDIPILIRNPLPFSYYNIISLFEDILNCNDFNIISIKKLLLSPYYPFKDKDIIYNFISFLNSKSFYMNLKSDLEDDDELLQIFKNSNREDNKEIKEFYIKLKYILLSILTSKNLYSLQKNIKTFFNKFFILDEKNNPKTEGNNTFILSKAMDLLNKLTNTEEFIKIDIKENPFLFYINSLKEEYYILPFEDKNGIKIYEYPRSVGVYAKHHFIINLTEKYTNINNNKYIFLKEELQGYFNNINDTYKILYTYELSGQNVYFTCSKQDYIEVQLPSIYFIKENKIELIKKNYDCLLIQEKKLFAKDIDYLKIKIFQQKSFLNYLKIKNNEIEDNNIKDNLKNKLYIDNIIKLSNNRVDPLIQCQRYFILNNLLNLYPVNYNIDFENNINIGNFYHKNIEYLYKKLKEENYIKHDDDSLEQILNYINEDKDNFNLFRFNFSPFLYSIFKNKLYNNLINTIKNIFTSFKEYSFFKEESRIFFQNEEYKIEGIIDNLIFKDNEFIIIDYKKKINDKKHKHIDNDFLSHKKDIVEFPSLQLLIYAYILNKNDKKVKELSYIGFENEKNNIKNTNSFYNTFDIIEKLLNLLTKNINNIKFEDKTIKFNTVNKELVELKVSLDTCQNCKLKDLCRNSFSI